MTFDPTSVDITCVTLPKDHFVQVPWEYISVYGYSDQFCKTYHILLTYIQKNYIHNKWLHCLFLNKIHVRQKCCLKAWGVHFCKQGFVSSKKANSFVRVLKISFLEGGKFMGRGPRESAVHGPRTSLLRHCWHTNWHTVHAAIRSFLMDNLKTQEHF